MFIKCCNVITVVPYYQKKLTCFTNVWWLCVSFFLNNITLYCVRAVISVVPDLHKIGKIYTPNGKDVSSTKVMITFLVFLRLLYEHLLRPSQYSTIFLIKWMKLQGETILISREQSCKKKIFVCTLLMMKWKFYVLKFISLSINWRNYC